MVKLTSLRSATVRDKSLLTKGYLIRIDAREVSRRYKEAHSSKDLETLLVCELEYVQWVEVLQNTEVGMLITRWDRIDIEQLQYAYNQFRSERSPQSTS